jgi:hypothetical protein
MFPGKTDVQIARLLAWKDGYKIVARFKLSASDKDYNHFAACRDLIAFEGYKGNPNCHDLEILFDTTKEAPKGLYCRLCKQYQPVQLCVDVHYLVAEDAVSFDCPDCHTSRIYIPGNDLGL